MSTLVDLDSPQATLDLTTGFVDNTDVAFARNSATYLANAGYRRDEIIEVLVQELGMPLAEATALVDGDHLAHLAD